MVQSPSDRQLQISKEMLESGNLFIGNGSGK